MSKCTVKWTIPQNHILQSFPWYILEPLSVLSILKAINYIHSRLEDVMYKCCPTKQTSFHVISSNVSQTESDYMPQVEKSTVQESPVRNVQLLAHDCSLECVLGSQVPQVLELPDVWKTIFSALLPPPPPFLFFYFFRSLHLTCIKPNKLVSSLMFD